MSGKRLVCSSHVPDALLNALLNTGKQKPQSKAASRKSKSPNLGQGYAGAERPSSVSSVHSEGDYTRQAAAGWPWEDRPSSTGRAPQNEVYYLVPW